MIPSTNSSPAPQAAGKLPQMRPKDRDAVLQSLRAGVVPRAGQHLIQVGRRAEIESMLTEIDRVADGGACFKLVIGEYGSGKTFFLGLTKSLALEHKLVVASADLNPDRRLHATGGQAKSLYAELARNLSTRTKPDGGALAGIVEKFVASARTEAETEGKSVHEVIKSRLEHLSELTGGYDFAEVVSAYWRGFEQDNEGLRHDAVRWLRGEFHTRTDARRALGVRTIVDDASFHDHLKLMARFVRLAGYSGLLVVLDEMVNLYKLANPQARNANYEQILRMLNDSLQGTAAGLGFVMGGTPEFLYDARRGLYGYPALQSRLAANAFAREGLADWSGPVIKLATLSQEEFWALLANVRDVYAWGDPAKRLVPDEALTAFMSHCSTRLGDAYFRTPRTAVTAFAGLLAVLEQNPGSRWNDLLPACEIRKDPETPDGFGPEEGEDLDDGLADFRV